MLNRVNSNVYFHFKFKKRIIVKIYRKFTFPVLEIVDCKCNLKKPINDCSDYNKTYITNM